ncbi:MAG TPA: hypothetical protein ENG86_04700 [Nitrospirae bacterium]|nr:hypothetical protein [Nitrospirota bacterium]
MVRGTGFKGSLLALRWLRSRRFAATFIILLISALVIGTVIPQRSGMSGAELFRFRSNHPGIYRVIRSSGLDHVYTTWWFLVIAGFFSANIALNLSGRIKISVKQFKEEGIPGPERIGRLNLSRTFVLDREARESVKGKIRDIVSEDGYRVKEYPEGLSASKGRWGLWTVPLFHGSILIILTGVLISSLTKFGGTFEISEGQVFSGKKDEFISKDYGLLNLEPRFDFHLRLRKFNAEYWDAEHPRLYQSVMDVYKKGVVVLSKKVEINEPLRYEGLSFYQSKYHGYSAYFGLMEKGGGPETGGYVNFPYKKRYTGRLTQKFHIPQTSYECELGLDPPDGNELDIKVSDKGKVIRTGRLKRGGKIDIGRYYLVFHDIVKWTGLYVKRDYGVPVVYTGFVLLVLSVFMVVFIVPKRVWFVYDKDRIFIGAMAMRTSAAFKEEFEDIIARACPEMNNKEGGTP